MRKYCKNTINAKKHKKSLLKSKENIKALCSFASEY
jgi:hypothetical protein